MSQLSLLQALATVHFGDVTPDQFLNATQAGRPASASGPLEVRSTGVERLKAALDAPEGRLIWEGPIPDKAGRYIVTNPYATNQLKSHDPQELLIGLGLTNTAIGEISGICTEVDEALDGGLMPLEEQAALYDALEAATGLRFSAAVLSGDARQSALGQVQADGTLEKGKSLHVWLSCDWEAITPERLILRQKAADILCAIVGGDPATRDLARKMRVGGVKAECGGRVRVQTCLRADPTAVQPLQAIHDALAGYAASQGLDVAKRLDALQTAAQCRKRARAWERACAEGKVLSSEADDAAQTLNELALEIRQGGEVKASHRRLMALVGLPSAGEVQITTQTGAVRTISTGHQAGWDASTTILTHTSGQSGLAHTLFASHRRGYRVPDIHCPQHPDAHASAYLTEWTGGGGWTIHCPTCGRIDSSAVLLPGQVVPEFKPAPVGQVLTYVPTEDDKAKAKALGQEEAKQIKADREASEARYLASPKAKAGARHRQAKSQSPAIKDLVSTEIIAEDAQRIEAGVMADLGCDEDQMIEKFPISNKGNFSIISPDPDAAQSPAGSIIPDHLLELAFKRYEELGVECKRGPTAVQPLGHGKVRMVKLACRARVCDLCGPRGRRAERAAIVGSIEGLGEGWAMARWPDPPHANNLNRWTEGGVNRVVLTVKISPKEALTLVAWAPGHAPEPRTLRKLDAALPVSMWGDLLFEKIDENVHPGENERAVSGTSWLTRQINAIKADLLKIKRRAPQAPTGGTFITHASPAEVRKRLPQVLGEEFYETSADGDPTQKGGLKAEIWKNPKGDIGADGSFPPEYEMGRPATPEEVHWACDHAELFRGKGQRRKAKGKTIDIDTDDGFYELDMSI